MSIPILTSNFWDVRTDAILNNLEEDEMLSEDLPDDAAVQIYKGYPRLGTDRFAVFVYRATSDEDEYSMGGDKGVFEATWNVVCVSRLAGDPAELEAAVSRLSANVLRNLCRHMQMLDESGVTLWTTGKPGPSDAATVRDEENQQYDVEIIPYHLWFELLFEGM